MDGVRSGSLCMLERSLRSLSVGCALRAGPSLQSRDKTRGPALQVQKR